MTGIKPWRKMRFSCLLILAGICEALLPNEFGPPELELSSVYPVEDRSVYLEWNSPEENPSIPFDDYVFTLTSNRGTREIRIPYEAGRQFYIIRDLYPATEYSISAMLFDSNGTPSLSAFVLNVTTAAGIMCSSTPTIRIGIDDIRRINPQPGDEIVITSRDVISTANATDIDPKCKITNFDEGAVVNISLHECEPRVEIAKDKFLPPDQQRDNMLKYVYIIRLAREASQFEAPYLRFPPTTCIEVSCTFDRELTVVSDMISPFVRQIGFSLDPAQGDFNVEFALFHDVTFTSMITHAPISYVVPQYIYAQIWITVPSPNFVLQTPTCWATPSADANDPIYEIITGGCAEEHSFDPPNAIVVLQNYEGHQTKFKLKAFVWTGVSDSDQEIFIHCQVSICSTAVSSNCTDKPCESRRKRSVSDDNENQRTITYGPISIKHEAQSRGPCKERNGGCEEVCGVEDGRAVCGCGVGKKLAEDGKSCLQADFIEIVEAQAPFLPSMTSLVAAAAILVAVLFIALVYKFTQANKKSPTVYAHL